MRVGPTLVCCGLIALASLSGHAAAEEKAPDFVWVERLPFTLDPAEATGQPESRVIRCLFEGLTRLDAKTLRPVPGAASGWTVSPDGRRYTFKIRKNARWSNGDRVLADDFVAAWKWMLEPVIASEYAYLLDVVPHAAAYSRHVLAIERLKDDAAATDRVDTLIDELVAARLHLGVDEGFWAPDPATVVVELKTFAPQILRILAQPSLCPVHRVHGHLAWPAALSDDGQRVPVWRRFASVVGNGPFVLRRFERGFLRLERNASYWGAKQVAFRRIEAQFVEPWPEIERRYASGAVDWLPVVRPPMLSHPHASLAPSFITYFLRLNTTRPHLKDPRVRRAISLAIDRDKVLAVAPGVGRNPTNTSVPPGVPSYRSPVVGPAFDVAEARRLLAAAGYADADEDGFLDGFPTLRYIHNTDEGHTRIAAAISKQLAKHLGIRIKAQSLEWVDFLTTSRGLDYDIARAGWIGDYLDAETFLSMFITGGGNNQTGWSDAAYDKLLAQSEVRTQVGVNQPLADSIRARHALLQKAEARLLDQAPIIPLYVYSHASIVRPTVGGFHPNVLGYHPIRDLFRK